MNFVNLDFFVMDTRRARQRKHPQPTRRARQRQHPQLTRRARQRKHPQLTDRVYGSGSSLDHNMIHHGE